MSEKGIDLCKRLLTNEERSQLGDILVRDLDDYYEEIKDIFSEPSKSSPNPEEKEANKDLEQDFRKWRDITNSILKKCDLEIWKTPEGL